MFHIVLYIHWKKKISVSVTALNRKLLSLKQILIKDLILIKIKNYQTSQNIKFRN